jgi:hypothetical protein
VHKGAVLATLSCAGLILGIGVWMVLGPLAVQSYTVVLRNPATAAQVVCHAAFAPEFRRHHDPQWAVSICEMSCEDKGFRVERGGAMIIDFRSLEYKRRAQRDYEPFIPLACRP